MNFAELHMAVRGLVHAHGLSTFTVSVQAVEEHANRVDVRWSIFVPREPPAIPYFFKSVDPKEALRELSVVLGDLGEASTPPELAQVGEAPKSADLDAFSRLVSER